MTYYKSIFLFLALAFTLVSCSSDDSGDTTAEILPVVGVWNLTEANVNIAQDPNEDGTASTNMVDELPCLTGILAIDASGVWTASITRLNSSPVTGDFYVMSCSGTQQFSGRFSYKNSQLNLKSSSFSTLTLSGTTLIENIGQDLPGTLSYAYEKQ